MKLTKIGKAYDVDPDTGEETESETGGMYVLPGAPGSCPECFVVHEPHLPHNQQSLSYHVKFFAEHGRYPTWTDAMAHCVPELRADWRKHLIELLKKNGMEIPADLVESTAVSPESGRCRT